MVNRLMAFLNHYSTLPQKMTISPKNDNMSLDFGLRAMEKTAKPDYSDQDKYLGKLMAAARRAKRVKQREIAAHLGCDQSFIAKVEAGKRHLDLMEFVIACRTIGVDPRKIIGRLLKRWPDLVAQPPSPPDQGTPADQG